MGTKFVTNPRTFSQTVGSIAGAMIKVSFLGATVYGVYYFGSRWLEHRPYAERESQIERAINEGDFVGATKLFTQYRDADQLLPEQILDLDRELNRKSAAEERAKERQKFEALVASGDSKAAQSLMEELAASGNWPANIITEFQAKISAVSEPGLFLSIQQQPSGSRTKTIDQYLEHYPDSPRVAEAVQYAIFDAGAALSGAIESDQEFSQVRSAVVTFNSTLDKYLVFQVTLPVLSFSDLGARLQDYANTHLGAGGVLIKGGRVRITPDIPPANDNYVLERNVNFPEGSVGIVREVLRDECRVEMDTKKVAFWTDDYGLAKSWGPKRNVVTYRISELNPVLSLSPVEREELLFEGRRMTEKLRSYTANQASNGTPATEVPQTYRVGGTTTYHSLYK
ncbi:MAG TPA: hypothetical protein VJK52_05485 [Candidatus Nanoarchaeia archaeon]|nr:hypothetical protein [Candidatus Nanoarchaeia archaeon]